MKKLLFSIFIVLTIILTACSSSSTGTPMSSSSTDTPTEAQLAVGTLKLAETDQDISVEQAEELVVYWQVYRELLQSETAAQAEIDGLIAQIEETMTDDQIEAIGNMNITQQDVFTSMQGVAIVSSNANDSSVSIPSGLAGGPPADGGVPPEGGEMPADMGGAAPAASTDQSQSAGADAGLAGSAGIPSALVQAVIEALQQKIAS